MFEARVFESGWGMPEKTYRPTRVSHHLPAGLTWRCQRNCEQQFPFAPALIQRQIPLDKMIYYIANSLILVMIFRHLFLLIEIALVMPLPRDSFLKLIFIGLQLIYNMLVSVFSKANQLYMYIYLLFFRLFSHIDHYSMLSRVPYCRFPMQQVLISHLFDIQQCVYQMQSPNLFPAPLSPLV